MKIDKIIQKNEMIIITIKPDFYGDINKKPEESGQGN